MSYTRKHLKAYHRLLNHFIYGAGVHFDTYVLLMTDAVFTWVDGSDTVLATKRLHYARTTPQERLYPNAVAHTRYADNNELYYAIRLLRQNTPWINRIYVVTDGQCPKWLSSSTSRRLNVILVDHTEIFRGYEGVLPTFNSVTIEHMIAHIPGLSDDVLYLNDDFFVLRPITRAHFFGKNKIFPRGQWRPRSKRLERIGERYLKNWKTGLVGYRGGTENIPFKTRFFMRAHTPIPIHIPSMQRILVEKNLLGRNISYRFRSVDQLDAIDIFLNHMLSRGMAKPGPDDWSYLEFEDDQADDDRCVTTLTNTSLRSETKFLCAQSLDRASPTSRTRVTDCLEGFLRQRSSLSAPD